VSTLGDAEHVAEDPAAVDRCAVPRRHGRRRAARPAGHDDRQLRAGDTQQRRPLRAEQLARLAGHGVEDLGT
jgi:hypothetical protein